MENFQLQRYKKKFELLVSWLTLKQKGVNFSAFFDNMGVHDLAIYGMGEIGRFLYTELQGTGVYVKYGLDREEKENYNNLPVIRPDNNLPKVDAIIITPVLISDEIEKYIYQIMGEIMMFTIEEVIYELERQF